MKVWTYTHLWTGEGEFPRIEALAFDSKLKASAKAKQDLRESQKLDPEFWKHEDLIIKGDLENENYFEAFLYDQKNTTFVGWYIEEREVQ